MPDYISWDDPELSLPPLSIQKTRSQPNPYDETQSFESQLRRELREDSNTVPATFDCSLLCRTQYETSAVGAFFQLVYQQYAGEFYKDLPTEYGMMQHLVTITGGIPQPDAGDTGRNEMMKYSFTAYVAKIEKPQFIIDDPLTYIKYARYSSIIDIAVNRLAPEA